ncbi:MAG: hypothetical protein RL303_1241 [Verrucomicrobiota bacterium]|jgi:uncharacterized protein (TIGR02598 family)
MSSPCPVPRSRRGFSLVEVTLAIGIVSVAILSLVGILGSTFQQVDDIMQTNRALAAAGRVMGALDNPRTIVYLNATNEGVPQNTRYLLDAPGGFDGGNVNSTNFDIAYRLLRNSLGPRTATTVWLYAYERKVVGTENDKKGDNDYALFSNSSMMEVAYCLGSNLRVAAAGGRNIVGSPLRVRVTLSKLLVGQRVTIDPTTLEPTAARVPEPSASTGAWSSSPLPALPGDYALAYLPVVLEFFPHDYTTFSVFNVREETPLLVQTYIISR